MKSHETGENYNEELHNFFSSPNIIRIRLRKMRWAGHVT
jgi:hypothetical protein